ncbi:MAG TPA: carbohydrate-binding family 9-like protein [Terriglobia bacterium]|nr:carbohydrate-binding family 9-like protein [Terriglobia bacterium]
MKSRKSRLCFIFACALSVSAIHGQIMNAQSPYLSSVEIVSEFSRSDFVPDGDLNKKVWARAKWVQLDHDMSGRLHYPEADTRVAALWTEKFVYFAFQCKYTALNIYEGEEAVKERWELWERDVVEVFINPQPERVNHYYEFEVAPNNQWIDLEIDKTKTPFNDAGWDSHFDHAAQIDSKNHIWNCEMRIPVSSMGVAAMQADTQWRLNFFRADGAGGDSKRRFMAWSSIPEGNSFHQPVYFGIIKFVE